VAQDHVRRYRQHLFVAVGAGNGDMNGGDLDIVVLRPHQNGRTGIAAAALAGMQQEPAIVGRLVDGALAVGGHGVPAVLAIAGDFRAGAAGAPLGAQSQRHDLARQAVGERQHHPVSADRFAIL
jgi:hypothetical protein